MRYGRIVGAATAVLMATGCNSSPTPSGDTTNGCGASDYLDQSTAGAGTSHTIGFGGTSGSGGFTYSPQCLTVGVGQTVTFQGDFLSHPLTPGVAPGVAGTASDSNPIPLQDTATSSVAVTFPAAGTYPYYCGNHYGIGMYGAIKVK